MEDKTTYGDIKWGDKGLEVWGLGLWLFLNHNIGNKEEYRESWKDYSFRTPLPNIANINFQKKLNCLFAWKPATLTVLPHQKKNLKENLSKPGVPSINFLSPYIQEERKCSVISGEVLCNKAQSVWAYMRLQIVIVFLIRQQNPTWRIKMKCTCLHCRYLLQDKTHVLDFP